MTITSTKKTYKRHTTLVPKKCFCGNKIKLPRTRYCSEKCLDKKQKEFSRFYWWRKGKKN